MVDAHLQPGGSGGLYVGLELGVGVQVEGLQRGVAAPDEHEGDAVCLHLFPVDGALPLGYINAVVDILGLGMGVFVGLLGVGVGTGGEGGDAIVLSVRLMPGVFPPILGVINGGVKGVQRLLHLLVGGGRVARDRRLFREGVGLSRVLCGVSKRGGVLRGRHIHYHRRAGRGRRGSRFLHSQDSTGQAADGEGKGQHKGEGSFDRMHNGGRSFLF